MAVYSHLPVAEVPLPDESTGLQFAKSVQELAPPDAEVHLFVDRQGLHLVATSPRTVAYRLLRGEQDFTERSGEVVHTSVDLLAQPEDVRARIAAELARILRGGYSLGPVIGSRMPMKGLN